MLTLDRRLHACRADLADIALKGRVEAERFVAPSFARLSAALADLRPRPDATAGIDTQILKGERLAVFDRAEGWAWVQAEADGYVGYLPEAALGPDAAPTHRVAALRSYVYSGPDLRSPIADSLSIGSCLAVTGTVETRGTLYAELADGGYMVMKHLSTLDETAPDYVAVAARFLETPYLWGGRSGFGLDCSGLVQLSMQMAGQAIPRDTDMQLAFAAEHGKPLARSDLRRGDLVFWKGHVGIMEDGETLLHANGHTMTVAREALDDAITRIAWLYGDPTGFFRIG